MKKGLVFGITLIVAVSSWTDVAYSRGLIVTDPVTGSQIIHDVTAPRYIYHWTTLAALARIAKELNFGEGWERFGDYSKRTSRPTIFFRNWPQFRSNPFGALFTWTHPILAMKGGEFGEDYGDVLVRIEIDVEKVKTAKVISHYPFDDGRPSFQSDLDVSNIDLVDHGFEWILLNPNVIKNFTADIDVLRPLLERELELLKDPNYRYDPKDVHFADFKTGGFRDEAYLTHAINVVTNLLQTPPNAIPSWFRRTLDGQPVRAPWLTGTQALATIIPSEIKRRSMAMHIESRKASIAKLDPHAPCDARCLGNQLEWYLTVHSDKNPAMSDLLDLQADLFAVMINIKTVNDSEILKNIARRMRESPFDAYRSFLDVVFLISPEGFDYRYNEFLKKLEVSKHVEDLRYAYRTHWLSRGLGQRDKRFNFLKSDLKATFSPAVNLDPKACAAPLIRNSN